MVIIIPLSEYELSTLATGLGEGVVTPNHQTFTLFVNCTQQPLEQFKILWKHKIETNKLFSII